MELDDNAVQGPRSDGAVPGPSYMNTKLNPSYVANEAGPICKRELGLPSKRRKKSDCTHLVSTDNQVETSYTSDLTGACINEVLPCEMILHILSFVGIWAHNVCEHWNSITRNFVFNKYISFANDNQVEVNFEHDNYDVGHVSQILQYINNSNYVVTHFKIITDSDIDLNIDWRDRVWNTCKVFCWLDYSKRQIWRTYNVGLAKLCKTVLDRNEILKTCILPFDVNVLFDDLSIIFELQLGGQDFISVRLGPNLERLIVGRVVNYNWIDLSDFCRRLSRLNYLCVRSQFILFLRYRYNDKCNGRFIVYDYMNNRKGWIERECVKYSGRLKKLLRTYSIQRVNEKRYINMLVHDEPFVDEIIEREFDFSMEREREFVPLGK